MKQQKHITILTITISLALIMCISAQKLTYKEQIIKLQSKLDKYEYYKYQDNQTSINTQINNLENQLHQANLDKEIAIEQDDPLGILRAEAIINRCSEEINQANIALAENKLQLDLNQHYIENEEIILENKQSILAYENYAMQIDLELNKQNKNHINTIIEQLQSKHQAEKLKFDLGYTTQTLLQESENNLKSAKIQLEIAGKEQENLEQKLSETANHKKLDLKLKTLDNDYAKQYLTNSPKLKQLNIQIKAYQDYIYSIDNSTYQEKAKLQLELLEAQKNQYKIDLETYTKDLELNYENLVLKVEITENLLDTLENKLKDSELLLQQEKITPVAILELKTEISKTNLEKLNLILEAKKIYYLLENQIEK